MRENLWLISVLLCVLIYESFAIDETHLLTDEALMDSNQPLESTDLPEINQPEVQSNTDGYCTYNETKRKFVTVSVPYTEIEKVYTRCRGYYFKRCLTERPVVKMRAEQKIQEYHETVRRCCEGYAESPDKRCLPICEHSCVFGNCTLPNTCTCYTGYKPKADKPNVCEPSCGGCTNGECVAPNICFCNPGYDWDSEVGECVPNCQGNCLNGKCIAPEQCECDDGYIHHPSHSICIPHCNETCMNGTCIGPNRCECDFGYHFVNGSQNVCEPFCELSCKNAKCVEPNVCECHDGYTIRDDNKPHECHCGLYCTEIDGMCHCLDEDQRVKGDQIRNNISAICSESNCQNGICLTPFDCVCYEGFERNEQNICEAANETCIDEASYCNGTDQHACICTNGICSANQECVCVNGFRMSDGHNDLCEPHCTKECANGFCINPDSCECDPGYTIRNESESHICYPICADAEDHDGCINGTCIAPDTCECNEGFQFESGSNHTCIPLPFESKAQKAGMHWVLTGIIPVIVFVVSLSFVAYYIHTRKQQRYNTKSYDEANQPIAAYLNEEM